MRKGYKKNYTARGDSVCSRDDSTLYDMHSASNDCSKACKKRMDKLLQLFAKKFPGLLTILLE